MVRVNLSFACVQMSTLFTYCSSSVISPSMYCSSSSCTVDSASETISSFSRGTATSLIEMVMPDLVAYLKPRFLIWSRTSAVPSLPRMAYTSATMSLRTPFSTSWLRKATPSGSASLRMILPTVVSIISPSTVRVVVWPSLVVSVTSPLYPNLDGIAQLDGSELVRQPRVLAAVELPTGLAARAACP